MRTTEHVEYLLRQGKKPEELVELGLPKSVVTSVRRRLRDEKAALQTTAPAVVAQQENSQAQRPESPRQVELVPHKVRSGEGVLQKGGETAVSP